MAVTESDTNVLEVADGADEESPRLPGFEPIPGYRLIEPLGKGGFGEVWKCQAPGGLLKAIKFVPGGLGSLEEANTPADVELRAMERIKAIRHPFILYFDRVERIDGDLTIVMELAERNLCDVLAEHRKKGLPGIPRATLLGYLREAAEALDVMNLQYGLQHLDVKPGNLFLVGGHIKVGDFSLVHGQLAAGGGKTDAPIRAVTPGYAPPELFANAVSPQSDQYSLAIVFQELLTGTLPFDGKNPRQLVLQHASAPPNLEPLPESDRPIVARALSKRPEDRYTSCSEFIAALVAGPARDLPRQRLNEAPPAEICNAETQRNTKPDTIRSSPPPGIARILDALPPAPTRSLRQPSAADRAALPGYEFIDLVGFGRAAEMWLVRSPQKAMRVVKILYGFPVDSEAVAALAALDHPALVRTEIVRQEPERLILASEPLEKSLGDRYAECQSLGFPGIPRKELMGYLETAAEAFDHLYEQHGVQHLGLHPGNLYVDGGRLRVADFGLIPLIWLPVDAALAPLNALYAAPEVLQPPFGPHCDQYSLALIYYDLVTGMSRRLERKGRRPQTQSARPDLSKVNAVDRDILARALDVNAAARWPSCSELVRALREAQPVEKSVPERTNRPQPRVGKLLTSAEDVVNRLAQGARPAMGAAFAGAAGASKCLQRFKIAAPLGRVREQLQAFRKDRQARVVRDEGSELVFRLELQQGGLWQRCLGRSLGLEVRAQLGSLDPAAGPTDIGIQFAAFGPGRNADPDILQQQATQVLDEIRYFLNELRSEQRFLWSKAFRLRLAQPDKGPSEPIECQGKDISLGSIRFTLSQTIPCGPVLLELPIEAGGQATVPARVLRVEPGERRTFEAVALFLIQD
jgi:serine/threonine protein kinase